MSPLPYWMKHNDMQQVQETIEIKHNDPQSKHRCITELNAMPYIAYIASLSEAMTYKDSSKPITMNCNK